MSRSKTFVFVSAFAVVLSLGGVSRANSATTTQNKRATRAGVRTASQRVYPILRSLSLHDRIAQLIVIRGYGDYPPSDSPEYRNFVRAIREDRVGGFVVAGRIRNGNVISAQPFEMAAFINHVQRLAKIPLLVGSDFERGASMRVAETARFPYLMAFGAAHDPSAMHELGAATAREARAIGVNWVFAPDADVNNNPDNPIINIRSYGEDPQAVASAVAAFIDGAHSDPSRYVLVTAKHFPGHGDTAQDSHMQVARLGEAKDRIESLELVPFRAAVAHNVDSVMTAHMLVPAFEQDDVPATVSRNILTGLLREQLAFKGLIVTDALEMQGIASLYPQGEMAVRAIEAGADVLLMPVDPRACIRAIMAAVKSGRISRQRIDSSVVKVLAAKQSVGLFRRRMADLDAISDQIELGPMNELAQRTADRAVTLVKDEKHLFPLPEGEGACAVIMSEREFSQRGETFVTTLQARVPGLKSYVVNPNMADDVLAAVAADTTPCKQIYVAAFVTVNANRGNVALQGGLNSLMQAMIKSPVPVALISLGNPYLLRDFPSVSAYAATFSSSTTSEKAAVKAILGDIPITGKMPVSIPGIVKVGEGLDVPAKARAASNGAE